MQRYLLVFACTAVLAGCQSMKGANVDAPVYRIPNGSQLVLNREINIPTGSAHAKLQFGKLSGSVNEYEVNCQFRVRDLGPRTVQPDIFTVTRNGDAREWAIHPYTMRFYKTLALDPEQQAGPVYLVCQKWADVSVGRGVSVSEMQEALGDYFSFPAEPVSE